MCLIIKVITCLLFKKKERSKDLDSAKIIIFSSLMCSFQIKKKILELKNIYIYCIKYYIWSVWSVKVAQSCPTLGQNTGVGSHSLLLEIFPTQGSNPGLPHCRRMLHHLSHQGSPRILEWVTYPFSSVSSRPRNQIRVSCVADWATCWATRKAPNILYTHTQTHKPLILYICVCIYVYPKAKWATELKAKWFPIFPEKRFFF